jgi:hypothetical protein
VIIGAAFEVPAVISGFDDVAVMGQAIEQGSRHLGIGEDARPFAEGEIGGVTSRLKIRFASFWKGCAARTVSPSCVVARGSSRTSVIAGRRIFWRPARSAWLRPSQRPER